MQKTVELLQVQLFDRVVDVPAAMQRQVAEERIQERIVEETDVLVPFSMEEILELGSVFHRNGYRVTRRI